VAIPWLEISLTHAAIAGQAFGDLKELLVPFDEDLRLFRNIFLRLDRNLLVYFFMSKKTGIIKRGDGVV